MEHREGHSRLPRSVLLVEKIIRSAAKRIIYLDDYNSKHLTVFVRFAKHTRVFPGLSHPEGRQMIFQIFQVPVEY